MATQAHQIFRPVAPPQIIENAYTADQHQRILQTIRDNGPWPLIFAQNFSSPEEIIAVTGEPVPEGETLTWDMVLSPKFRGWIGRQGVCYYPELHDCYYNAKFLEMARNYWSAQYAEPETFLFNIQGASSAGGLHLDAMVFRGMTMDDTPFWLLLIMAKSGLFRHWQSKKAQVTCWYYKGTIGGGFNYWPDGARGAPRQIKSPMWGRAVVAENEMMFHHAQASGRAELRKPKGLDISSVVAADPNSSDGWRIETFGEVTQLIPGEDMRLLLHWGARVFMDYDELRTALDHKDDISREQALDILIGDLRRRNVAFEMPSDPMNDRAFIALLGKVYDIERPANVPPDPE